MKKLEELIKYAFWGGISTAINLAILFALITYTDIHYLIANAIAYTIAVLINYVCNKKLVFRSTQDVKKELSGFLAVRVVALAIDSGLYYLLVDVLKGNVYVSRILLSIVIIGATFFVNKFFIFSKK